MDILSKIDKIRKDKGWSVYRLATESGLTDKAIYNWYQRGTMPTIKTLESVCEALGVTISQFFAEGELVELDIETKKLFDEWITLSSEQKAAVLTMIKSYKK